MEDLAYLIGILSDKGVASGADNSGNLVVPADELSKLRKIVKELVAKS